MDTRVESQLGEIIQLVSFRLGNEDFVVDILKVQEIHRMVEMTKLPEVPHYCEGVIDLRGKVIPVLNLRKKFELEDKEWDKDTRIIVCVIDDNVVGMIVDAVDEVLRVNSSTIEPAPDIVTSCGSDYITGVAKLDERLLIFLDVSRIAIETSSAVEIDGGSRDFRTNMTTDNFTSSNPTSVGGGGFEGRNIMNSIEMIVGELKEVTRTLNDNTGELVSAAADVVSCAQATVKAAEHVSELTGKQAQCATLVSTTVEKTTIAFTDALKSSGDNTRKLAEMIKRIQAETESARKSIEAGIEVVHKGREIADKANSSLTEAFNMSKEAMAVIDEIAPSSEKATSVKKGSRPPVTV